MKDFNRKDHWENIYRNKKLEEVSWFQPVPETSLNFFEKYDLPLDARIIDVGGGDSFFVDILLGMGYEDITVLDISKTALEKAKKRLGDKAKYINWIVADAANFKTDEKFDFWHDRAAFHFLTKKEEVDNYVNTVSRALNSSGILVIGTFSETGPEKCSGIDIKQYSEEALTKQFEPDFKKEKCIRVDHNTPSNTVQNFTFCSFKKAE
ncbi:MAG: class I SAM-dependent methyltransferase [Christiangramia sp.]